ncbi:DUF3886 domain-containing protein [Metabacillus idriensis]|uniref:DUF3886 domain-containing protein n=1 Tax=Metabacillus idriensis TaxID=324768 RepID=UPI001749D911|nr:DUF3886 domain-containing protein [Metabacillus idriensis]
MAKKQKKQQKPQPKKADDKLNLKDHIESDLFQQLSNMKKGLMEEQEQKIEEERLQKIKEKKEKEKNKSFEELLNDSNLKWNDYK